MTLQTLDINTEGRELCFCTNCRQLLIDKEPEPNDTRYTVPDYVPEMIPTEEDVWVCPKCKMNNGLKNLNDVKWLLASVGFMLPKK